MEFQQERKGKKKDKERKNEGENYCQMRRYNSKESKFKGTGYRKKKK